MRQTTDFLALVEAIQRVRASGLSDAITEGAVRAIFDEYKARANDVRLVLAAERLALNPQKATDGPGETKAPAQKARGVTRASGA